MSHAPKASAAHARRAQKPHGGGSSGAAAEATPPAFVSIWFIRSLLPSPRSQSLTGNSYAIRRRGLASAELPPAASLRFAPAPPAGARGAAAAAGPRHPAP